MKPRPFDYARPDTVEEAVAILAEHGDDARILAGGQTLLAMLNLRVVEPAILVDITRIPKLDVIREVDGRIEVGAAVTQNRLMAWPALAQKLPLLAAALPFVGHFQTRNKGTVCGAVAHADPTSEIPLSLALLEGEVVLRSRRGTRVLAAGEFQQGMLATAREGDELITAVRFAVAPSQRAFKTAVALSAATAFTAITGICTAFAAVGHHAPDYLKRHPESTLAEVVLLGIGESMSPGILGFTILSLIAIIMALGVWRQNPS